MTDPFLPEAFYEAELHYLDALGPTSLPKLRTHLRRLFLTNTGILDHRPLFSALNHTLYHLPRLLARWEESLLRQVIRHVTSAGTKVVPIDSEHQTPLAARTDGAAFRRTERLMTGFQLSGEGLVYGFTKAALLTGAERGIAKELVSHYEAHAKFLTERREKGFDSFWRNRPTVEIPHYRDIVRLINKMLTPLVEGELAHVSHASRNFAEAALFSAESYKL